MILTNNQQDYNELYYTQLKTLLYITNLKFCVEWRSKDPNRDTSSIMDDISAPCLNLSVTGDRKPLCALARPASGQEDAPGTAKSILN